MSGSGRRPPFLTPPWSEGRRDGEVWLGEQDGLGDLWSSRLESDRVGESLHLVGEVKNCGEAVVRLDPS